MVLLQSDGANFRISVNGRRFLFSIEVDQMNKMRKCDKLQSLVKHLLG